MDKIYSRKRFKKIKVDKVKLYKNNKEKKIKLVIVSMILGLVLFFIFFIKMIIPVFEANCLSKANSLGVKIVNEEVRNVMLEYTYDDLIVVNTDNIGNITFLESNIISINEIIAKITSNIQLRIDENESSKVYINMGTISGLSYLKNVGPSIGIRLETGGSVRANINTEFITSGINQTLHRVYIDIKTTVKVATPIAVYNKVIDNKVLLAEAIIVGKIPETYYNFEDVESSDALEMMGD
jgi:sporulation protein YunB